MRWPVGGLHRAYHTIPSPTSQVCFGLSPLAWLYAVGSEVFALNNAFAAGLISLGVWAAAARGDNQEWYRLLVGALLAGLGLCNQHTLVLFALPLVCFFFVFHRATVFASPQAFLGLAAAFFTGLLPYAYLALAHSQWQRAGSWGYAGTLAGLLHHMARKDYGTFQLYSGDSSDSMGPVHRTLAYLSSTATQQLPRGAWAALLVGLLVCLAVAVEWGVQALPCRSPGSPAGGKGRIPKVAPPPSNLRPVAASMLLLPLLWVVYLSVFHSLANLPLTNDLFFAIHGRFWMQPGIIAACFTGLGLAALTSFGQRVVGRGGSRHAVTALAAAVLVAGVVSHTHRVWPVVDNSSNRVIERYGRALLEPLPPNATLITAYDMQWTAVRYLTVCEGVRPDVTVLNAPMMTFAWFRHQTHLHTGLTLPGAFLAPYGSASHIHGPAFSFGELLQANLLEEGETPTDALARVQRTTHRHGHTRSLPAEHFGGLFVAGEIVQNVRAEYEGDISWIPAGLALQAVRSPGSDKLLALRRQARQQAAVDATLQLPDTLLPPYDPSTWEHAVRMDRHRVLAELGTDAVAEALPANESDAFRDLSVLLLGLGWLERVVANSKAVGEPVQAHHLKNLGLGYSRLVRQGADHVPDAAALAVPRPHLPHLTPEQSDELSWAAWRSEAAMRVLSAWGEFLAHPGAAGDSDVASIDHVVRTLRAVAQRGAQQ